MEPFIFPVIATLAGSFFSHPQYHTFEGREKA